MIKSISFAGNVNPVNNQTKKEKTPNLVLENDCFVKQNIEKDKSIEYAKQKIIQHLKGDGKEYSVVIAPSGEILDEKLGNSESVSINPDLIVKNAVMMHGHPIYMPLSTGDVATLLATDAKSEEAIMENGQYSKVSKTYPFKLEKPYFDLYTDFEKRLCIMGLSELGYDCEINSEDFTKLAQDYLSSILGRDCSDMSADEANEMLLKFGVELGDDLNQNYDQVLNRACLMAPYKKLDFDKAHNIIKNNYDELMEFLNSPKGKIIRHKFLEKIAQEFDLNYETDMF